MFELKSRTKKQAALVAQAENRPALATAVYETMCRHLLEIGQSQMAVASSQDEQQVIFDKAVAIKSGIDAYFLNDQNPYGAEMSFQPRLTQAGAMIALGAHNMAALTGSLSHANIGDKLSNLMNLPPDHT